MKNINKAPVFFILLLLPFTFSKADGGYEPPPQESVPENVVPAQKNQNFGNVFKGPSYGNAGRLGGVYQADLLSPGSRDQIILGRQSVGDTTGTQISILSWDRGNLVNTTAQWMPSGINRIVGTEPSVQFADFFNTGRTDMFVAAGWDAPGPGNSQLYRNIGGRFERITIESKAWGHGSEVYDLNGDGFKDIVIADYGPNTTFAINNKVNGFTSLVQRNPNSGIYTASSIAAGDFLGNGSVALVATDMGPNWGRNTLHSFAMVGGGVDTPQIGVLPTPRFQLPRWAAAGFGENLAGGRRVSHDVRAVNFDFNSDGRPDVIVMSRPWKTNGQWPQFSEIQFLKNNGSGNFVDVTDSTVVGYNTSMPVSYNPRFVDLNGDGLLDILLPQQTFGLSNGTQLLLRAPNGQYVAAFTQVFNEFGAAAAAAGKGSTGANGNVITMVNAPNGKTYLVSFNLQGVAYLSEVGSTGTISAAGIESLIKGKWPWLTQQQVAAAIQSTSTTYNGFTVIDSDAAMRPVGDLGIPFSGRTIRALNGGISGVRTGDFSVIGLDSLGRSFNIDLQPMAQLGLNAFERNTQQLDQHYLMSHAEYLINGPVNTSSNVRVGVDALAIKSFGGDGGAGRHFMPTQQGARQFTAGIPSLYKRGYWNFGTQFTTLNNNPFLSMSGTFGFVNSANIIDNVVSFRHPSGFTATASLMHVSTDFKPGLVTNVSDMMATWAEVGYRAMNWTKRSDLGFYAGVMPYLLSGNVTANIPTAVDAQGNIAYTKRNMTVQNTATSYARLMYSTSLTNNTIYRASGMYMANGQYRLMQELRFLFN